MNVRNQELMSPQVLTTTRHRSVEHVRQVMSDERVSALPVTDVDGGLLGIVTTTDLLRANTPRSPVGTVMSKQVVTVPAYGDPHEAARIMRKHGFHHVVVTHEKRVVGILSTFDLLRLVEDRRFVAKNAPTAKATRGSRPKASRA